LKRRQAEALIAAVEAIRRNAQVQQAAALIAGIDSVVRRKGSDGQHRSKRIAQSSRRPKSRGDVSARD
jgi:hypothetical protein